VQAIDKEPQQVISFKEKPILPTAIDYLQSGRYFWNAGMFCFTTKTILSTLSKAEPEFFQRAQNTFKRSSLMDLSQKVKHIGLARRFEAEAFSMQKNVSLDYAVMEPAATTGKVSIVPASFSWSDVGSWKAVAESYLPDENGNTSPAQPLAIISHHHSYNTHVHCRNELRKHIATIGINDVIIVDTSESLLVVHRNHAQEVGIVVNQLQNLLKQS
jgi:mannose-1-phosphate guanylyltransferase / mannose-6-phosphate isomerase